MEREKKNVIVCVAMIFLMMQWSCASTGGPMLSDSAQKDMQQIGIVIKKVQEQSLEDSKTGFFKSLGKGAGEGSVIGAGAGLICGPGAIICVPVLAAAGAVGGAGYGLYQAGSEILPDEVESLLNQAITDAELPGLLMKGLVGYAKESGYDMSEAKISSVSIEKRQDKDFPVFQKSFDTLLEVEGPVVNLLPASYEVDPPRRVGLSARVQVLRVSDQEVLADEIIFDELGDVHSLEEWTSQQARQFREELPRASQRLSEKILNEFFMRYEFEERNFTANIKSLQYRVKGLKDLSLGKKKPMRSSNPTLRWETFQGGKVTYDLRVWESKLGSRTQVGEVVYVKNGLTENSHTVETALNPSESYVWSVRARFVKDGKSRVTDWSTVTLSPRMWFIIIGFGIPAIIDYFLGEDFGFYPVYAPIKPGSMS